MSQYEPKIYVACLASYNAGHLHGRWIEADQSEDEINAEIQAMLAESPVAGEDYAIHDYEGFGSIVIEEHTSITDVVAIASALERFGGAFEVADNHCDSIDEALQACGELYSGQWSDLEGWAENFLEDTGSLSGIPDNLRHYFDFERYARDCELGGDIWSARDSHGNLHVFYSH